MTAGPPPPVGAAGPPDPVDSRLPDSADTAPVADPPPSPRRRPVRAVLSALAVAVVFAALVVPARFAQLGPEAFVRIPVEGLVAGGLFLLLPARARRVVAALLGVLLGVLTVLRLFDLGFSAVLARPFDPLVDAGLLVGAYDYVRAASGDGTAVALSVGTVALGVVLVAAVTLATVRVSTVAARHRTGTARALGVLTATWLTLALLGAEGAGGLPVAAHSAAGLAAEHAGQVGADIADRRAFEAAVAVDTYRDTPDDALLGGLRGKDVALVFVESYGRTALDDPQTRAALDDGTRALAAAGFGARTGFLTSPTSGGGSWLAHATLVAGVWIDDQPRYDALAATGRTTLGAAFRRAGWRTAGVMPGVTEGFPESGFYGYDEIFDAAHLGYRGPNFSFASMPDQFTLQAFQRLVREPGHAPVMAEIPLVSSHAPWEPLPRLVGWDAVGDGSVYDTMSGPSDAPEAILTADPAVVRANYLAAVRYSVQSLVSYVQTYGDDDLVLVFLGDHQPAPVVTGVTADRDVPITVVARDPAVLDRVASWGWDAGLVPGPRAPVWPMDAFRDQFLRAFTPG